MEDESLDDKMFGDIMKQLDNITIYPNQARLTTAQFNLVTQWAIHTDFRNMYLDNNKVQLLYLIVKDNINPTQKQRDLLNRIREDWIRYLEI